MRLTIFISFMTLLTLNVSSPSFKKSKEYRVSAAVARRKKSHPATKIIAGLKPAKMDTMRQKMKLEDVNHFARLPEELLLCILGRMDDLKFLCQCSLVSKRFATTIFLIDSVSLTLPNTEVPPPESVEDMDNLFPNIPNFTREEITSFIQLSSIKYLKFLVFLQKFKRLKSVSLEFTCGESICSSSLLNMKIKFTDSGTAVVEKLVSLVVKSVFKETDEGYNNQVPCCMAKNHDGQTVGCSVEWLIVLSLVVKCLPSLECAILTNSKKQGKLVLRGKHIVAWRKNLIPGGFLDDLTPGTSKVGWLGKLRLPASGLVLRGVYYVIAEMDPPPPGTVFDESMTWEYVGEKKLIDEALREIPLLNNQ